MRVARMQTMMAPSTMLWVCSFIFLALTDNVLGAGARKCEVKECLHEYQRTIPQCNEDSKGLKCLNNLYNYCAEKNDTVLVEKEWRGLKIAERLVCAHSSIRNRYQHNLGCWYGAIQCSRRMVYTVTDLTRIKFCHERELLVEDCIKNVKVDVNCTDKELNEEFINKMFQSTPCCGSAITVQLTLMISGVILALFGRI